MELKETGYDRVACAFQWLRRTGIPAAGLITYSLYTSSAWAQSQPSCTAQITNQWGSGSQVQVTVANASSAPLTDWRVELSYSNGSVVNSWNAAHEGANPAVFRAPNWSPSINGNSSYSFGFIAEHGGGLEVPNIDACYFGEPVVDDDGDGINNSNDLCPNTATDATVDTNGCANAQLDDDQDGVLNGTDQCPATPSAETADSSGCSAEQLDDDADSVINRIDACPDTAAGQTVDAAGCSNAQRDDDNDGVKNGADSCPETVADSTVDLNGCAEMQIDLDGDGIVFGNDTCPDTPSGLETNEQGCAAVQLDEDGDGVQNSLDFCPQSQSENVTHFGCELGFDPDGDHIPNDFDLCPNSMGLVELHGCKPSFGDFDGDGVSDLVDECPYSIHPDSAKPMGAELLLDQEFMVDETGCSPYDLQLANHGRELNGLNRCSAELLFTGDSHAVSIDGCTQQQRADDDADGVINGLDTCPNEFGMASTNGCPHALADNTFDMDNDGVPNERDHCPASPSNMHSNLFGEVGANGCLVENYDQEDLDQDGVSFGLDLCPASPRGHRVDDNGCTAVQNHNRLDDDMDGIINRWDLCPETHLDPGANINAFGCDSHHELDMDGIPDSIDQCPHESGLLIHRGCPTQFTVMENTASTEFGHSHWDDKDNDGIPDFDDRCPYSKTPASNDSPVMSEEIGCFIIDFIDDDSDGVINGKDRCPMTHNVSRLDSEGCSDWERLDSDGDQLINGEDLCPHTFGFWQTNGCAENPLDADQDGAPNALDQCPYTDFEHRPAVDLQEFGENGARNRHFGCAHDRGMRDDDADGVINIADQCPNTPFGEQVWPAFAGPDAEQGCSFSQTDIAPDSDNDGVHDMRDQCPNSDPSKTVDEHGCFDPWGDHDGDNVANDMDHCPATRPAAAMAIGHPDTEGCATEQQLSVAGLIQLRHIAAPSPELPPESQENEIDLIALLPLDEHGPFDHFQMRQAEIGEFEGQQWVDLFLDDDQIIIHVHPMERLRTFRIPVRIKLVQDNQLTNWFEIVISPRGNASAAGFSNVIINDANLLAQTGITLHSAFTRLSAMAPQPFGPDPAAQLYRQLWDSQRSNSVFGLPFSCTGEINGFPIICDRFETEVALFDDFATHIEMDRYRLTAVVNRFDLRKDNWQDCGEHRLVFALQDNMNTRNFINLEARVPNPTPGDLHGCEPSIRFWLETAELPEPEQAQRITEFAMGSEFDPYAILSPEHFFEASGQIRSNQFVGGEWLLKEHKLVDACTGQGCAIYVETVNVKENPFGELFNPNLPFSSSPFAMQAMDFQNTFWQAIDDLAKDDFEDVKLTTAEHFNHGQSHAGGPEIQEVDYRMHFGGQLSSPFGNDMLFALQGRQNADGSPLEVEQVLARASGLSCGGCHNPEQIGLTEPGSIGALRLPDGSIIDSWPRSHDFVHINELGELSPGMLEVYLPVRQAGFEEIIREFQ